MTRNEPLTRPCSKQILALVALLGVGAAAQAQPLLWADEFQGDSLDLGSWEPQIGTGVAYGLPPGWGNNELQYYTDDPANVFVANGFLHIVAREQELNGLDYTSARIRTQGKQDFLYGRVEARIKLPTGQGIWPAFWMLPTDSPYGGWAAGGELDVVETINIPTEVHGTAHFGGEWPDNTSNGGSLHPGFDVSNAFHRYAMEWTPDEIRWYFDDQLYHTLTSSQWWSENGEGNPRAPFDHPFHLILNVAVGGNWPGAPDGTAEFPQEMLVDWVRVYDLTQYPFPEGQPHPVPGRVEAEDFDEGFPGEAHNDCDSGNNGGAYRDDVDVDIQLSTEGGFNLGWICPGEWTEYTVDVAKSGSYTLEARVASPATGGVFLIAVDGVDATGPIFVPVTGGWQNWESVEAEIPLDAGQRILQYVNLGGSNQAYNVNWFDFQLNAPPCPGDMNDDGVLSILDFLAFQTAFGAQDRAADCNEDGFFSILDFLCFQAAFALGCP